METVNLEIAKKLARRKWNKGQTKKMYQKEINCSVYNLKDNCKNAYCSYDAPNIKELIKIAEYLRLVSHLFLIKNVNEYANKLIDLLKAYKLTLEDVRI